MSNLQQALVRLIINALCSTNLTIESFVIMAISAEETGMNPLSRSFLDGGITTLLDRLLHNGLICSTVSNWVILQAMKIYKKEMSNLTSKDNGFHFHQGICKVEIVGNINLSHQCCAMLHHYGKLDTDQWRFGFVD